MKAIERNISRHENGTLYFVARRAGKLVVFSLKTKSLEEARRKIREQGVQGLVSARAAVPPLLAGADLPAPVSIATVKPTLLEAIDEHDRGLILLSDGAKEMAERGRRVVLQFCRELEVFDAVVIWKDYRASGVERLGQELGSAANHLKWYLGKFVPWAVSRGYLPAEAEKRLNEVPRLKVNPRRIRVPDMKIVDDFLRMVSSEDAEGGDFLRFLAVTGFRLRRALGLRWENIDLGVPHIVIRQKGGKDKVLPITPEAVELLRSRLERPRPFELDQNAVERLERRMKRFAKGLGIDLKTFHSFRHYFASRCLLAGLTVQEVALLLGHSDQGQLVLAIYGHICAQHLHKAVAGLRLAKPD